MPGRTGEGPNLLPAALAIHPARDGGGGESGGTDAAAAGLRPSSSTARPLPILSAFERDFPSDRTDVDVSLVRLHRLVTTALVLALASAAAWRAEAFLADGSWTDLAAALLAGPAAVGLLVYVARLNVVLHREPGPGVPRDIED